MGHASRVSPDFNIGYAATVVLAICFVVLGMATFHGAGRELERGPGGFAYHFITLITAMTGEWAYYPIGIAAIAVILMTTIALVFLFLRFVRRMRPFHDVT